MCAGLLESPSLNKLNQRHPDWEPQTLGATPEAQTQELDQSSTDRWVRVLVPAPRSLSRSWLGQAGPGQPLLGPSARGHPGGQGHTAQLELAELRSRLWLPSQFS